MPVSERVSTRKPKTRKRTSARRLALGGAAVGALAVLVTGCGTGGDDASSSIVRTTTNIAGASVVGIERDTTRACALPSAPDQASGTHTVAGTQVSADPKRIVVLDTAALDAVCAVGLWERVVGATTTAGPASQPNYLGTGVLKIPSVGTSGAVDTAKISTLQPDLILGAAGDGDLAALRGIAPTVLVDHRGWQDDFTAYAEALGRGSAGAKALADYRTDARETGASIAANLSQASVIRFSPKDIQAQGTDTFAGQVLADAGVQRPGAQRDGSFTVDSLATESDRNKIEGDIIYLMFDGPDGKSHGESVMKSDDWKKLGAIVDKRDFAVEDDLWHGSGLTAARAILDDLRKTLNGYVTD
ncbi:putative siderophore-binding lipoprotein YfiY [Nocardia cerradoensis]|uniref:Putative siderophore-binding lipoprotein YfiY n=1 Tax=Nocardia cerradoensis TaxID=85688 RepID=A0A231H859_9NOCA|nr:ABC transporter substrate-binding protein [Nocardia cerradoensis]OXR45039.1 putative siderophore-binding lipoprotein YfiY [Nocardia cerradoensis]